MAKERAGLLSSGVRRQIADLIRDEPGRWTAPDLAEELHLHVTTVRFHLDQLEQAGVIDATTERRDRPGRPRKVYSAHETVPPVSTVAYVILADVLADTLATPPQDGDVVASADAAGARWVDDHHRAPESGDDARGAPAAAGAIPVPPLLDTLAQWGYPRETVTVEGDPATRCEATLTYCPMADAARRHPEVVCGIHLGLVRGSLTHLGVEDPAVRVVPMITPGVCSVEMSTAAAPEDQRVEDGLDLSHVR